MLIAITFWGISGDHVDRDVKPAGLLQPLPVPEFRWQWVRVDFITDLPETKAGHTAIVVFVDRLSRMVHFARWNDMGAEEFAQIIVRVICRLHLMPLDSLYPATPPPPPMRTCGILPYSIHLKKNTITQGMSHTAVLTLIL